MYLGLKRIKGYFAVKMLVPVVPSSSRLIKMKNVVVADMQYQHTIVPNTFHRAPPVLSFKFVRGFGDSLTNRRTKFHSMYQGLLVSTSECSQQNSLDPISVLWSRACPFFRHILLYVHLSYILTTG